MTTGRAWWAHLNGAECRSQRQPEVEQARWTKRFFKQITALPGVSANLFGTASAAVVDTFAGLPVPDTNAFSGNITAIVIGAITGSS